MPYQNHILPLEIGVTYTGYGMNCFLLLYITPDILRVLIYRINVDTFVVAAPGIYAPVEMIDFGILRTLDEPTTVQLSLVNTGSKPLHVTVSQKHPSL